MSPKAKIPGYEKPSPKDVKSLYQKIETIQEELEKGKETNEKETREDLAMLKTQINLENEKQKLREQLNEYAKKELDIVFSQSETMSQRQMIKELQKLKKKYPQIGIIPEVLAQHYEIQEKDGLNVLFTQLYELASDKTRATRESGFGDESMGNAGRIIRELKNGSLDHPEDIEAVQNALANISQKDTVPELSAEEKQQLINWSKTIDKEFVNRDELEAIYQKIMPGNQEMMISLIRTGNIYLIKQLIRSCIPTIITSEEKQQLAKILEKNNQNNVFEPQIAILTGKPSTQEYAMK